MLSRALSKAKKEGGKKVPINFQVPSQLKEDFEHLCKTNEVSLTSMLIALMETAIEEAQGVYFEMNPDVLITLNNKIEELESFIDLHYHTEEPGSKYLNDDVDKNPQGLQDLEDAERELSRLYKIFDAYKG